MSGYRIAVVGATGAVGREVLRILDERRFPLAELRLLASPRSAGRRIDGRVVLAVAPEHFSNLEMAIFDTPDAVAEEWVPVAAARGVIAIDNSAAFRMAEGVPLVIPEINGDALAHLPRRIVANPNCTAATIAVPLAALHKA
ncbi:MAG: aspartate-semialdehyde dehydrogenase, partial [bacterium]